MLLQHSSDSAWNITVLITAVIHNKQGLLCVVLYVCVCVALFQVSSWHNPQRLPSAPCDQLEELIAKLGTE